MNCIVSRGTSAFSTPFRILCKDLEGTMPPGVKDMVQGFQDWQDVLGYLVKIDQGPLAANKQGSPFQG